MTRSELMQYITNLYGTQKQFADAIKMPTSTLSVILDRGIMSASFENVIKICNGLHIPVTMLVPKSNIIRTNEKAYIESQDLYNRYLKHPEYHEAIKKLLSD